MDNPFPLSQDYPVHVVLAGLRALDVDSVDEAEGMDTDREGAAQGEETAPAQMEMAPAQTEAAEPPVTEAGQPRASEDRGQNPETPIRGKKRERSPPKENSPGSTPGKGKERVMKGEEWEEEIYNNEGDGTTPPSEMQNPPYAGSMEEILDFEWLAREGRWDDEAPPGYLLVVEINWEAMVTSLEQDPNLEGGESRPLEVCHPWRK